MQMISVLSAGPYNTLYAGAFALAFAVAAWMGRRRGWPMLPWLTLLAACIAGGIAGSKLFHFDLHVAEPGEKTILGGLMGGMIALLIAQRFLRFSESSSQVLAPAALLGFALGRVGCFLVGCCYGLPTSVPWGVQYAPGTRPFAEQVGAGLIESGAAATLPVHPSQLYEAALALLLAGALWRWGSRLRAPAAPALALAVGYGLIRFGVEFYRAGGTETLYLGLKTVQWTVGAVALAATLVLLWREQRVQGVAGATSVTAANHGWHRAGLLIAALLTTVVAGDTWFTPLEQVTLFAALAPATLCIVVAWCRPHWTFAPGCAALTLLLVPPPADTLREYPYSYYTAGGGAMTGSYVETCGPPRRYTVGGASMGYTHVTGPNTRYSERGQVFTGSDKAEGSRYQEGVPYQETESLNILGIGAMGQYDTRYVGLGLGGALGNLVVDGDTNNRAIISGSLRFGRLDRFFVEGRLFNHEPASVPAPILQLGAGFAIDPHGSTLRAGISDAGFYGGANVVTRGGLEIDPFLAYADQDTYQVGLTVRQRFGFAVSPRR